MIDWDLDAMLWDEVSAISCSPTLALSEPFIGFLCGHIPVPRMIAKYVIREVSR
jgi:hypothetical protein